MFKCLEELHIITTSTGLVHTSATVLSVCKTRKTHLIDCYHILEWESWLRMQTCLQAIEYGVTCESQEDQEETKDVDEKSRPRKIKVNSVYILVSVDTYMSFI